MKWSLGRDYGRDVDSDETETLRDIKNNVDCV